MMTKIHVMVDGAGLPIMLKLTEVQAHVGRSARDTLDSVRAGIRSWPTGTLRQNLADRGPWGDTKGCHGDEHPRFQSLRLSLPQSRGSSTGKYTSEA
jgi:hypothetical protein